MVKFANHCIPGTCKSMPHNTYYIRLTVETERNALTIKRLRNHCPPSKAFLDGGNLGRRPTTPGGGPHGGGWC